jgi:hypothetical protein
VLGWRLSIWLVRWTRQWLLHRPLTTMMTTANFSVVGNRVEQEPAGVGTAARLLIQGPVLAVIREAAGVILAAEVVAVATR